MSGSQSQNMGSYLYCVTFSQPLTSGGKPVQANGIAGNPVRVITQGDLAAMVSDSPSDEYEINVENMQAHEGVIEAVMQRADVLPVNFGVVAPSDQDIQRRILQQEAGELRARLMHVKGRVELGVKALWNEEALFARLADQFSDIQELREQIAGTTTEQTYDLRIQLGELTDSAIGRQRDLDAAAILNALSPLAVSVTTNQIVTDMMIVNAAFLVDKSQTKAFSDKAHALEQANAGKITLHLSDALPPYSFVTLAVRWEEPSGAVAQ